MMDGRVRQERSSRDVKGENVPTSVHSQSLNQSLILRKVTIPLLSANTQNQLANRSSWPAQKMTANYTSSASGRGLWDASGITNPATDTCRGHHGATYTGADGDGWRFVWVFFLLLWKKIACNHVIKDYHK